MVSTFGQPQAEYAAVRKSVAIMDMPQRGLLELTGRDRLSFLNNLLTNATWNKQTRSGLAAHSGVYAFFLNVKGRIVTDMNVLELGDRTLLDMDARMVEPVRLALDKYLFSEQVKLASRSDQFHELFLTGPKALDILNPFLASPSPALDCLASANARLLGHDILIFRDDLCGVPGYFLLCPTDALVPIWTYFTQRVGAASAAGSGSMQPQTAAEAAPTTQHSALGTQHFPGARPFGWAVFNTARIEAGRPLFGIDFDDSVLPAETGQLGRAVSLTKGCYLGQEIVARMHARGQLARQLVGLKMNVDALPIAGNKIYDEAENEIGGVTSSTLSPVLSNAAIGLGYLKKAFITPGTQVRIPAEGAMHTATVVELPFVKSTGG
jgi:folate-binding protein YgfZ